MITTLPFGRPGLRRVLLTSLAPLALLLISGQSLAANCTAQASVSPDHQNRPENSLVTLNGQSSKPNGQDPIAYLWTQVLGPTVVLNTPTAATTTFTAPNVGPAGTTLRFNLRVTGCSPSQVSNVTTDIVITNVAGNTPPFATASDSPDPALEGDTITLSSAGSSDPDAGDTLTFFWTQLSGPTVVLSNPSAPNPTFLAPNTAYPSGASLQFDLAVSDGNATAHATTTAHVVWSDDPPIASLSCPSNVDEGDTLTLNGTASSDSDDGIATYAWTQTLGSPNVDLSGYDTSSINFAAPALGQGDVGNITFRLTVTDFAGQSDEAICSVMVNDVTDPVIFGAVDQTLEATSPAGATATYDVTATDNVDPPSLADCSPASPHTFDLGINPVSCTADDSAGNTATASFNVTVVDTTAPVIDSHGDVTEEATSAAGAIVNYTSPATSDAYDGNDVASCAPASGTQFAYTGYMAGTLVTCNATDNNGNVATPTTFNVFVVDSTPPTLSLPADITAEATSGAGAAVSFTATATDIVDGSVAVNCAPASGTTFALGTTLVECTATDSAGNPASGSFNVTVVDTTPPTLSLPADITAEATSGAGAAVSFTATATDIVDGSVAVNCAPASGSTFALGTTLVECSATDNAGNPASGSFDVTVVDTTPPTLSLPADITAEATSGAGAAVSFTASATDIVDGSVAVNCTPASGSTFALGTTTVNCSAIDAAGNDASGSFTITVQDTTAPVIAFHADVNALATSASGAVVTYTLPTASDLVDGSVAVTCTPVSGSTFAVGSTAVDCSATDAAGNTGTSTFNVIVSYNFTGFFKPIDNLPIVNVVKAGQAIPVKFSLGGNMGLAIMAAGYPRSVGMVCSGSLQDAVEETVTAGGSSLSYDPTTGQYIYVWKSEKAWAGSCRQLQVKLADGTYHYANFSFTR